MQVLWGRPCLVLEPVRAFAFGQGARAPTLGGVRLGDRLPEMQPGVESPTAHVKLLCHLLVGLQKHKMLPVFPGHECLWMDGGLARGEKWRTRNAPSVAPTQ